MRRIFDREEAVADAPDALAPADIGGAVTVRDLTFAYDGGPPVLEDVSFEGYRFDTATGRLWSGTREVRLTPKASAVLGVLVTHAGQPVSKEELFASVWNDTVVSDDALTSCIQELRRALDDDARQPRFIETRHRRGYQFVAPLSAATN